MAEGELKNVILDTNFFVDMFRFKVSLEDIEDVAGTECNFWVVEESVSELKKLKLKEAKVAVQLVEDEEKAKDVLGQVIGVLRVGKHVATADEAITELIEERKELTKNHKIRKDNGAKRRIMNFIVATNDAKLRKQIKALSTRVIYLRARKHLEMG
jgi:rRNA-processing protein FCF1